MENTTTVKTTPKDFFMHLLGFAALYTSIVSFLALIFAYIDVTFPDPLSSYYSGSLSQIRLSSSVLLIIFPVFILTSWLIARDFSQEPEKRNIKFRKWLIYFTLFIAAITVIVDLITLIFNFYSGDLTTRFLLKTLTVLVVALVVGTPAQQRAQRFDERRVNDLMVLQNQIISYWQNKDKLPSVLDDLQDDISGFIPPVDPETQEPYTYKPRNQL